MRLLALAACCLVSAATAACAPGDRMPPPGCGLTVTANERFRSIGPVEGTVLFVIDDSPSMCDEQSNLRTNLAEIIRNLSWLGCSCHPPNLHFGFVTTDMTDPLESGRLQRVPRFDPLRPECPEPPPPLECPNDLPLFLEWDDPDFEQKFVCMGSVGSTGAATPAPLGAVRKALSPEMLGPGGPNEGFLVPDAPLWIVLISDGDDCTSCEGLDCGPLAGASATDCAIHRAAELSPVSELVAAVEQLPGVDDVRVATVTGLDDDGGVGTLVKTGGGNLEPVCDLAGIASATPAPRLLEFAGSFDGSLTASICDPELADAFDVGCIGSLLTSGCLQQVPCPGTTAEDVLVTVASEDVLTVLEPGVDYTLEPDQDCGGGWRIRFPTLCEQPGGALFRVIYAADGGNGCQCESDDG